MIAYVLITFPISGKPKTELQNEKNKRVFIIIKPSTACLPKG